MFLRTINAQSIRSNLEFRRGKAKRQEREDPDEDSNRISGKTLERAYIHSLRADIVNTKCKSEKKKQKKKKRKEKRRKENILIPQPIPKINPLHHD